MKKISFISVVNKEFRFCYQFAASGGKINTADRTDQSYEGNIWSTEKQNEVLRDTKADLDNLSAEIWNGSLNNLNITVRKGDTVAALAFAARKAYNSKLGNENQKVSINYGSTVQVDGQTIKLSQANKIYPGDVISFTGDETNPTVVITRKVNSQPAPPDPEPNPNPDPGPDVITESTDIEVPLNGLKLNFRVETKTNQGETTLSKIEATNLPTGYSFELSLENPVTITITHNDTKKYTATVSITDGSVSISGFKEVLQNEEIDLKDKTELEKLLEQIEGGQTAYRKVGDYTVNGAKKISDITDISNRVIHLDGEEAKKKVKDFSTNSELDLVELEQQIEGGDNEKVHLFVDNENKVYKRDLADTDKINFVVVDDFYVNDAGKLEYAEVKEEEVTVSDQKTYFGVGSSRSEQTFTFNATVKKRKDTIISLKDVTTGDWAFADYNILPCLVSNQLFLNKNDGTEQLFIALKVEDGKVVVDKVRTKLPKVTITDEPLKTSDNTEVGKISFTDGTISYENDVTIDDGKIALNKDKITIPDASNITVLPGIIDNKQTISFTKGSKNYSVEVTAVNGVVKIGEVVEVVTETAEQAKTRLTKVVKDLFVPKTSITADDKTNLKKLLTSNVTGTILVNGVSANMDDIAAYVDMLNEGAKIKTFNIDKITVVKVNDEYKISGLGLTINTEELLGGDGSVVDLFNLPSNRGFDDFKFGETTMQGMVLSKAKKDGYKLNNTQSRTPQFTIHSPTPNSVVLGTITKSLFADVKYLMDQLTEILSDHMKYGQKTWYKEYKAIYDSYYDFDIKDSTKLADQKAKYNNSDLLNQLPTAKQAEFRRQQANCDFWGLIQKRQHHEESDDYEKLKAPWNATEMQENKTKINRVINQLDAVLAIAEIDLGTKEKAQKSKTSLKNVLSQMKVEAANEQKNLLLKGVINISSGSFTGWSIDKINLNLTDAQKTKLATLKVKGYSLQAVKKFDGKGGGDLALFKNGSKVVPAKVVQVSAFQNIAKKTDVLALLTLAEDEPINKPTISSSWNGGTIDAEYSKDGGNKSPAIKVENLPAGTTHVGVVIYDETANNFIHAAKYNIPIGTDRKLNLGVNELKTVSGDWVKNDAQNNDYTGPYPPVGSGKHNYVIKVIPQPERLKVEENDLGALINGNGNIMMKATFENKKKNEINSNSDEIFTNVYEMPRFDAATGENSGAKEQKEAAAKKEMLRFIYKNLKYPNIASKNGIEGLTVISFVVEKNGSMTGHRIAKEIGGGCGEEALRVVKLFPKFTPGKDEKGDKKRVLMNVPIRFKK